MTKVLVQASLLAMGLALAAPSRGAPFSFSTGTPDGHMATASRPANLGLGQISIEAADDFELAAQTTIDHATFTGLLPSGASLSSVQQIVVSIYRVFPLDSVSPPSGHVPTRSNSPSDTVFASRDSAAGALSFAPTVLSPSFTALNSVINGINPIPGQTTGGEGAVNGEEVAFAITFTTPFVLPAGHYYFVPQVGLSSGNFLWLSAPRPIVAPGTPFAADVQSWIRNANLSPDWLRIGTDIVGGVPAPTFNGAFTLSGTVASAPVLQGAVSRKAHGAAGTFDLPLSNVPTSPTTEPRTGPTQTLVFTFDKPITGASAALSEGTATLAAPAFSGNTVTLALGNVTNQQYVTVTLSNVTSSDGGTGGTGSVRVGFLLGDVNESRVVSVADLGLVNAQLAQTVTAANYLKDVNASGTLTVADKGIVNANLTKSLAAP
jgi:hypothetical protein